MTISLRALMADKQLIGEEQEMSFLDHLEVLRWHIVRSLIAVVITSSFAFVYKNIVFDVVLFGPKKADFITYRILCKLSNKMSELLPSLFPDGSICIGQNLPDLTNLTMAGQFSAHILISLIAGFVVAFPYILWEVWRFIGPGLSQGERKNARGFVFFASMLFMLGVSFGYFMISPLSVNFLMNYQVSDLVVNNPTLSTYNTLVTTIVLACGAVFELPILVYFLTKLGLLTPEILRAFRKHAFVGALVLSAVITPPDVFSQIFVSIPVMILYEVSIRISGMVVKKQAK
jgi:sec-independent protein translocase protein TatC